MSLRNYGRSSLLPQLVVGGLCMWFGAKSGPLMIDGAIQPLTLCLYFLAGLCVLRVLRFTIERIADSFDWLASHTSTGWAGTARWGKHKDFKNDLNKTDEGPFWGVTKKGKKLFIDFISNACIVGPSGSGKGHTSVIMMIFLIRASKVIMDFKPELLCICKKGLEKLGQIVVFVDPIGVHADKVGSGISLNYLDNITDDLYRPGGLRSVESNASDLAIVLYEENPNSNTDQYWPKGTQNLIKMVSITECMLNGYEGTLPNVSHKFDDPSGLELRLCLIVGENLDGSPDPQGPYPFELADWAQGHSDQELNGFLTSIRAKSAGILKQIRSGDKGFLSFLEGARQSLTPFGFGELAPTQQKTSFDLNLLKDEERIVNFFVVGDASKEEATRKLFELSQWFIQTKLKRHKNKHVPVYFINDEVNNYTIYGLLSLLSWGRGFGIRTINYLQNFSAFETRYGNNAVDILNSESEIKLILPGQRSPSTKKQIVQLLGEQSIMAANLSKNKKDSGLNESLSENARPLMNEDELGRSKNGILFVRDNFPIEQEPVSYSETDPLRSLADINPNHGKAFLRKVKLKLKLPSHEDR